METKYDVDFFIRKFSKIPARRWICDVYEKKVKGVKKCCALGFCYLDKDTGIKQGEALIRLFDVVGVNDNLDDKYSHLGKIPKTRILTALKLIKKGVSLFSKVSKH